jgi:hypothetical protein
MFYYYLVINLLFVWCLFCNSPLGLSQTRSCFIHTSRILFPGRWVFDTQPGYSFAIMSSSPLSSSSRKDAKTATHRRRTRSKKTSTVATPVTEGVFSRAPHEFSDSEDTPAPIISLDHNISESDNDVSAPVNVSQTLNASVDTVVQSGPFPAAVSAVGNASESVVTDESQSQLPLRPLGLPLPDSHTVENPGILMAHLFNNFLFSLSGKSVQALNGNAQSPGTGVTLTGPTLPRHDSGWDNYTYNGSDPLANASAGRSSLVVSPSRTELANSELTTGCSQIEHQAGTLMSLGTLDLRSKMG